MSGLLSSIFDAEEPSSHDGTTTSQDQEALGAHSALDLDPSVSIHLAEGGSYGTPDGAQHQWSAEQTLSLHADVDAATDVIWDESHTADH